MHGAIPDIPDIPAIPGLHHRTCPSCGERVTLTDAQSTRISRRMLTERHVSPCPSCGKAIDYIVPRNDGRATKVDVSTIAQIVHIVMTWMHAVIKKLKVIAKTPRGKGR